MSVEARSDGLSKEFNLLVEDRSKKALVEARSVLYFVSCLFLVSCLFVVLLFLGSYVKDIFSTAHIAFMLTSQHLYTFLTSPYFAAQDLSGPRSSGGRRRSEANGREGKQSGGGRAWKRRGREQHEVHQGRD